MNLLQRYMQDANDCFLTADENTSDENINVVNKNNKMSHSPYLTALDRISSLARTYFILKLTC